MHPLQINCKSLFHAYHTKVCSDGALNLCFSESFQGSVDQSHLIGLI